jgi:NAD(P)H-dependent flavin oxidoreductase YrpB (nitropropane dioxygenase family)
MSRDMTGQGRLADLALSLPVLAAPMAGGPTTPALVIAAARAGGFGFLAGGYLRAEALAEHIDSVAAETPMFGVNLFARNPVPVERAAYDRYHALLGAEAERLGVALPQAPVENDDWWDDKLSLLVDKPVPVVSFTFGIPDRASLAALRNAGSLLIQTVTSRDEALLAADAGVDILAVQASGGGGHSGTLTPHQMPPAVPLVDLVADISQAVGLPTIAAGGLAEPTDVAAAIHAGAQAVMVGTALLRAPESGTSAAHRKALADPDRGDPVLTRAFTGRPARGLRNTFLDRYDGAAPAGYPALHYLTRPLRQAAVAAGDPEFVNLWAGVGYRAAVDEPAEQILRGLASRL